MRACVCVCTCVCVCVCAKACRPRPTTLHVRHAEAGVHRKIQGADKGGTKQACMVQVRKEGRRGS